MSCGCKRCWAHNALSLHLRYHRRACKPAPLIRLCLDLGRVISEGRPAEVLDDRRVVEAYLGPDAVAVRRSGAVQPGRRTRARPLVAASRTKSPSKRKDNADA